LLLSSDQPRARLVHPAQVRTSRTSLLGYVAGAAVLAMAVTAGLMAIDPAWRDQASRMEEERPSAAPAAQPAPAPVIPSAPAPVTRSASAPAPALASAPVALPAPVSLAAPAQPASPATPPAAPDERLPQAGRAGGSPVQETPPPVQAGQAVDPAVGQRRAEPGETAAITLPSAEPGLARAAPATAPERGSLIETAAAPLQCLPDEAKGVLAELAKAVGEVEIVSTTELHTDNHSPGSARAKLHGACRAVDLKAGGRTAEAAAFLRSRSEIAAVQPYRNGVIHIDFRQGAKAAAESRPRPSRRIRAARSAEATPAEAASPPAPAPPSLFAPVPPPDIAR
jgi:hypothetical protein